MNRHDCRFHSFPLKYTRLQGEEVFVTGTKAAVALQRARPLRFHRWFTGSDEECQTCQTKTLVLQAEYEVSEYVRFTPIRSEKAHR